MFWQVFRDLQYEIYSTLFVVLLTNFMLDFHKLLVRNGKKKGMTIQAFWDVIIDHVSKPIITWTMGCFFFFFFFKHLWNPQHFLNHRLLLLQAFMKSSTFPRSWASSSSSSICEILHISSISSSIKNLCLLLTYLYVCWHAQCSISFTYYKCLSFEKQPTLFTLAHAHLRHPWNPCFWGKGKGKSYIS